MLFKVNPTKQNIQTEQGALVVTGNCYVQLHTPLTDMRRFKVLIKQEGKKRRKKKKKSNKKARVIPLWETRNKTAWHQSPPKETHTHTHTHTHSHTNAQCILTFTLTSSDYWAVAVPPLIERVSVSEEKHNICRTRGGEKNKIKAQQGIILVSCVCVCVCVCVCHPNLHTHTHTRPSTIMLVTILKSTAHSQLYIWSTLWQCLLDVMCKK